MNYKLYCIKDVKVGFMQPFVQPNEAVAVREFTNLVNSDSSVVGVNYTDMELWQLGEFSQDTGIINSDVSFVVRGSDVKKLVNGDE